MSQIKLTNNVQLHPESVCMFLDIQNLLASKNNATGGFTYTAVGPCVVYMNSNGRPAKINGTYINGGNSSNTTYGFMYLKTGDVFSIQGYENWNQTVMVYGLK